MIESSSQNGQRRMMTSSQCSAQSAGSLSGATETETKTIRRHRGSASGLDPPRSSTEVKPRLLQKIQLKENITSYLHAVGHDPSYWPVISAEARFQRRRKH